MKNWRVWKPFYSEKTKPSLMKMCNFLYGFWKSGEWKLILPSNFVFVGKNYYEPLIDEAHVATAYGGVEKTMQYLPNRYQSQSFSALAQALMASCDTCQRVKHSNKALLELVTPLHVRVRPWTYISMHFVKLTPVFIKSSTIYPNIEIDNDHMLCISRMWTIVDSHSAYEFLIPIPDDCKAAQCTRTHEVHLLPYIGDPNTIVFDGDSLCMSDHLQAWAASTGIRLAPSSAYHQHTDGQREIVNTQVVTIVRACELEADQWVKKLPEIQQRLNSRYNSLRGSSPFHTLHGFTARFDQAQMLYHNNKIIAESDRHGEVTNNLKLVKERQSFQANKRRNQAPKWKIGQQLMLSTQNMNLPNVNKKMKPRWLGPFPITKVNY